MLICITLISDHKILTLELSETELIDSLSSIINSHLKTVNIDYFFIFKKSVCEFGKTLEELNFTENCKVFAIQKNAKPLKRELKDDNLKSILSHGPLAKKFCMNANEDHYEYITWKNESLQELQNKITELINQEPKNLELIMSQPGVQDLIRNPSVIPSIFSANSVINDLINNNPDQVKFFTDISQYEWIENIMADSNQYENITNNCENVKNILETKRYKRMLSMYEKASDDLKLSTNEINLDKIDSHILKPLIKSKINNNIIDLLKDNVKMAESILQSCPYGPNLSAENLSTMVQLMPEAMDKLKSALAECNETDDVVNYLRSNPIEISEDIASKLGMVTESDKEPDIPVNNNTNSHISEIICAINNRINSNVVLETQTDKSTDKFDMEIQLLNEMGFDDDKKNIQALSSEYGNIDRVVNKLLTVSN